jgi:hypothetical protein
MKIRSRSWEAPTAAAGSTPHSDIEPESGKVSKDELEPAA